MTGSLPSLLVSWSNKATVDARESSNALPYEIVRILAKKLTGQNVFAVGLIQRIAFVYLRIRVSENVNNG